MNSRKQNGRAGTLKRAAVLFLLAIAAVGALLQLLPAPRRTNPSITPGRTLQAHAQLPPLVDAALRRSCMDCHSYETRWPWYSRVAPLSWGIATDVAKARKAMNLSEWTSASGRVPAAALGKLAAICAGVKSERMPPASYLLLHPDARTTTAERDAICAWTQQEMRRPRGS